MLHTRNSNKLPKFITTEKAVGETPLIATERLRKEHGIPESVPLAYAGRLDPMASGKLLILIGDECKVQEKYHAFDKEYLVEILVGVGSDTGDVLGILTYGTQKTLSTHGIHDVLKRTVGSVTLPYPHFSSKTVHGKPLHMWTLEGRLGEIDVPMKKSYIYKLALHDVRTVSKEDILRTVRAKIETIPTVTDERKVLGADFRRGEVRKSWDAFNIHGEPQYQILTLTCIASSGTYMRSLAEYITKALGTTGLAYSIHRTKIGKYRPLTQKYGLWTTRF